jgi:protein gp37
MMSKKIHYINPKDLLPHPKNEEIYGDVEDVSQDFIDKIEKKGILTPLLITTDNRILSGHRRHKAALILELESAPVIYSVAKDETEEIYELIVSNNQREKTNEQKAREWKALLPIEEELAKRRQLNQLKQNQDPVQENFPERGSEGQARDKAAEVVGMSGKSAETASKVVEEIDRLKEDGDEKEAEKLSEKLNKSVSGAYREVRERNDVEPPKTKDHKPQFNSTNENIDWAKWSWNPVTGCLHGCPYCYARDIANRFYDHGFEPHFYPDRLSAPENTKVPNKEGIGWRNVFVCSMGDLFGAWVEQDWIDQVMEAVRNNQQWNFLFLTKNPARLADVWWPENAWVGTTVDCQARVDAAERAFSEMAKKGNKPVVSFISFEPLSEPITINLEDVDWVIIGGQSKSSQAAAEQPLWDWVEDLHNQARYYGCKVYWKPNLKVRPQEYPTE